MYWGEFLHSLLFICMVLVKKAPKLLLKCPIPANIMGFIHQMKFNHVQTANGKIK